MTSALNGFSGFSKSLNPVMRSSKLNVPEEIL